MSDSDTENKVLGKRPRDLHEQDVTMEVVKDVKVEVDDESDDDVGPMPMPAGPENGGVKKKRKGTCYIVLKPCSSILTRLTSLAARETVPGPSAECRQVLQEFHAPGRDQLCCYYQVSDNKRIRNVTNVRLTVSNQDRILDHYLHRRSPEILEEAGARDRVCQALSSPLGPHCSRFCERRRPAVC